MVVLRAPARPHPPRPHPRPPRRTRPPSCLRCTRRTTTRPAIRLKQLNRPTPITTGAFPVDTLDASLYERLRGVRGALPTIMKAIETVREAGATSAQLLHRCGTRPGQESSSAADTSSMLCRRSEHTSELQS